MNKSTPVTSRIQKRSIGGIVQPAIKGMGSVAKMLKNSAGGRPSKDSPAKQVGDGETPQQQYTRKLNEARNKAHKRAGNAIKSFFTPDGSRDPRLSKNKNKVSNSSPTNKPAPKTKMAGRTPYTAENSKGKIHGPKDSYAKAYEKRDMKVYGNMNQAEFTKEAKRQTKSFETTGKFDAPKKARKKVSKVTSLKPEGVDNKKMSIENIAAPRIKAEKLVAKAPKTAKQTRKSNSIDKKLAKAKIARASGNIKKAERKEKRAENKQERMAKRSRTKSENTAIKGNKAVDEGRDRKADRLLKRAARQENREIKKEERKAKRNK
jgi:hypothetical protein